MDINATLLVEMVIFLLFFMVTKHYVWPPIMRVLDERRAQINAGLKNAETAKKDREAARQEAEQLIHEAGLEAKRIIHGAQQEAQVIRNEIKKQNKERMLKFEQELENLTENAERQAKKRLELHLVDIASTMCEQALLGIVDRKEAGKIIEKQTQGTQDAS